MDTIVGFADRLWKDLVGGSSKQDGSLAYSVTTIALGFTGVEPGETGQQSIEGFFRSGTGIKPPSSGSDGQTYELCRRGKRGREAEDGAGSSLDLQDVSRVDRDDTIGFVCPRCHQRFEVKLGYGGEHGSGLRQGEALDRLRLEHSDFHVAQDLSKMPDGDDGNIHGTLGLRAVEKRKKRKTVARKDQPVEGIAKFFVRKPG